MSHFLNVPWKISSSEVSTLVSFGIQIYPKNIMITFKRNIVCDFQLNHISLKFFFLFFSFFC